MSLILNGTNGVSDVDGSASTPAIRGTDTNTGMFFPAADTIAFAEGGTEVMRIDSSGNVGLSTNNVNSNFGKGLGYGGNTGASAAGYLDPYNAATGNTMLYNTGAFNILFGTNNTERMRIDSSGNLLVNTTSLTYGEKLSVINGGSLSNGIYCYFNTSDDRSNLILRHARASGATSAPQVAFLTANNTQVGTISSTGSATSYGTSSDYRLKENIQPMTGALAKVQALKPVTYKWKVDGSDGQGFIAHELAEVVPDCVTGEKDAVDADGNPVYQGIDTSFLVATLTAAIQELKAELDTVKTELATLKGAA